MSVMAAEMANMGHLKVRTVKSSYDEAKAMKTEIA